MISVDGCNLYDNCSGSGIESSEQLWCGFIRTGSMTVSNHSPNTVSRKQKLNEALVDMIVKDNQPFSFIEDEGFQNVIEILDPS